MLNDVLSLAGQTVCRADRTITVDGIPVGDVVDRPSRARSLPRLERQRRITEDEVFLTNRWSETPSTAATLARGGHGPTWRIGRARDYSQYSSSRAPRRQSLFLFPAHDHAGGRGSR